MFYDFVHMILQRVGLLLANDLKTNNETTSAARQQIFNEQAYEANKQTCSHENYWSTTINGVFHAACAKGLSMGQV
jgi:hypothetical protein